MAKRPDLSIVIETGTRALTDRISVEESVLGHLTEARAFARKGHKVEVLYVGKQLPPSHLLGKDCRALSLPGTGYYGWKNAAFQAARGKVVVFWDSDCRPQPGYLSKAWALMGKDTTRPGVTGQTHYDGTSYLSRLNTLLSFGHLFISKSDPEHRIKGAPLSHNLVVRKSRLPKAPFGHYLGRVGGDQYLGEWLRLKGTPLALEPDLVMLHEDPSFSFTALLERHMRESFNILLKRPTNSKMLVLLYAFEHVLLWSTPKRLRKVVRYGKGLGFGPLEALLAVPVVLVYLALDLFVVAAMALTPPFFDRWIRFHFGTELPKVRFAMGLG